MCGIAGIWGADDEETVVAMLRKLTHRGPDGEGIYRAEGGVLGHRRLAIVDLDTGDQPLCSEDGRFALVGNGEIYNADELREKLQPTHTFRTRSDNEAALHLHADRGAEAIHELEGMFALAITDGSELTLYRDPVGIKPLYLGRRNGAVLFSSELTAFPPDTTDVKPVPPGSTWSSKTGWGPRAHVPRPDPHPAADADMFVAKIRATLENAVERRLMGDVPVGAFLSGGLDSSAIAAIAAKRVDNLQTFTVGTENSPDLAAARVVAKHIGSDHHEFVITEDDLAEALPHVVVGLESFDQDLVRSAVPTYLTARLAAEHVKVILTGEGADELFAGYQYYRDVADERMHDELHRSVLSLHDINLQRVDRMTMAHSLEARVPFLDLHMIEVGLTTPIALKRARGDQAEKWVLREAVSDLLPFDVVWRGKEQFGDGSGVSEALDAVASRVAGRVDADEIRRQATGVELRSAEEAAYYQILVDGVDNSDIVLDNVARWEVDRPDH